LKRIKKKQLLCGILFEKIIFFTIMRKYYTLLVLTLFAIRTFAQDTIPNPGFERWTVDSVKVGSTEIPDTVPIGWTTPNPTTLSYGGTTEVTQSDSAYSGKYAAQLETRQMVISFGVYTDTINVPGFVLLGKVSITLAGVSITGGVPFTGRPDSLYGYYKYAPETDSTDSCLAYLYLTHWNTTKRDTLAAGAFISDSTVKSYTKFFIKINYDTLYNNEIPDTIQLAMSSSYNFFGSPPVGSTMLVDDLTFSADTSTVVTGINTLSDKGFSISCYPDPANKNLNIIISEPRPGIQIKVYDALGRTILSVNNEGLITSIDVSKLSSGLYFYEVIDSSGNSLKSDKFTVVR
jgi:hypothetical protein